jgi:hypothetical protein
MRRKRWWERFQIDRYRSGELATELQYRRFRLNAEVKRHHWGVWFKTPKWVYRARVVWR